ncbi:MAG TPA: class II aldolase/adducin family protein [Candidatus Binatia bacterium]|nr:class II aldolase/adducin family protein [Candidatus Binatia bacterium]
MKQSNRHLASLKKDFVTALRIIEREGLSDAFAHLSARVDGGKKMLFMPRKSPALVKPSELFVVDFDKVVPQSTVHQAVYKLRADVNSVLHFHSPAVILLSVVGQTVRPMHNYSAIFYEGVPVFEGTGQVESPERAGEIARLLGPAKAVILRGHGAVVVGRSIREACILALYLEESARLQVEAMKLGTPNFVAQSEAERIAKRTFKPASTERAWEHFAHKASL